MHQTFLTDVGTLMVYNTTGIISITQENSLTIARAQIHYPDNASPELTRILDGVEVLEIRMGDTLKLVTHFDEKLFQGNKRLWDYIDDIYVEYELRVPPDINLHIEQKKGTVYSSSLANDTYMDLEESHLSARLMKNLNLHARESDLDISSTIHLDANCSSSKLNLIVVKDADLHLRDVEISTHDIDSLKGDLHDCQASLGLGKRYFVHANNSSLEFTNIRDSAMLDLVNSTLVMRYVPYRLHVCAEGGSIQLHLDNKATSQTKLTLKEARADVYTRRSALDLGFSLKKKSMIYDKNEKAIDRGNLSIPGIGKQKHRLEGVLKKSNLYVHE